MDNQLLTLSKIFTERLLRIPDYQRGYAWTDKQLKDFWNDIQQLEQGSNHYTGVLTLENVSKDIYSQWDDDFWIIEAKSYQPYFVVDGQQRLTTAIILIQAILERIGTEEKLNFTNPSDIKRKFIFDSKDDGGISRSYIFGYERDNPSYEFLKTKIFCERSSSSISQETLYTQNLFNAKQFFANGLANLPHSDIQILYKKVTQHLLFNVFTITDDVEVCVAFETMNNRGKPLSYLELLKNRLIYLSIKFDEPDYERAKLRRIINDCWKTIYHNLGRNKDRQLDDDFFLSTHYVTYFGKTIIDSGSDDSSMRYRKLYRMDYAGDLLENRFIPKNVMLDAPNNKKITMSDVYNYVNSLQHSVETWYDILNPFESNFSDDVKIWLDKINRIGIRPVLPLILVFFQSELTESNRLAFLKAMERQLFISSLTGRSSYGILLNSDNPIDLIKVAVDLHAGKSSAEKITKQITEATNNLLSDEAVLRNITSQFRSYGFYHWDGIRYFLFEYDLDLQHRSKTQRSKIFWSEFIENKDDYISVEHIYPQNARDKYWTSRFNHLSTKHRKLLRDSLGNLLPLSKPKNSSLSNKPFPNKVDGIKDCVVGYRFGCYAENEVAKEQEWNPDSILQRGLSLLLFMERRWHIRFSNEIQKKSMLGLDFMDDIKTVKKNATDG